VETDMSKIDKLKDSIKQGKKFLIIIAVLWCVLAIVLVAPIACSWVEAKNGTGIFLTNFVEDFVAEVTSFTSFFRMFKSGETVAVFLKCLIPYTIAFLFFTIKGYWKTKPKGKYYDIEHGSSDWSVKGEQYKVLSENKGIILAEDNYLPIDKRGNINTLIVGRFWFW
jgi:hypothetical protein